MALSSHINLIMNLLRLTLAVCFYGDIEANCSLPFVSVLCTRMLSQLCVRPILLLPQLPTSGCGKEGEFLG